MNNVIEFKNVSKTYPNFSLKEISFEIPKGYITGFIGPNGSGKTTSIKLILSMIFKDSGEILINNNEINNTEYINKIGIVMDESYLMKDWYIKDLDKILSPFSDTWNEELFNHYLKQFKIDETYKVDELSKGMTTKLMIAIALAKEPDLLVLDEPTSGLDPSSREEICDILQEFVQNENKSVLFSTHITTDLEAIADNIVFILNGEIVFNGIKDDLLVQYKIIKGGLIDLDTIDKSSLIGMKKNHTNFEALVPFDFEINNRNIIEEKTSLDQIIIFFNREVNHE